MDDFENDEYDEDVDQYERSDSGNSESIKDKYDRYKDYKDKYDKFKNRNMQNPAGNTSNKLGQEAGKNIAQEGGKQAAKQGGKEVAKQGAKEAGKEAGKQVAKQAGKEAAKQGAKVAAEGAASSTGVGVVVAAGIEAYDKYKKVQDKLDQKIKEETGVDAKKVRRWSGPAVIFAIVMLVVFVIFIVPAMAMFSVSDTATSELTTLVRTREFSNDKELILFTKSELKDLLKKDIDVDESIATKLADEGFTLDQKTNGKYESLSYKSILKSYKDINQTFIPNKLEGITDGMEEILDDGEVYDNLKDEEKDRAAALKNVRKYVLAEVENFNKINWQKASLSADYGIKGARKSHTYTGDTAYNSYLNDSNKIKGISGEVSSESVDANYTVKDKNNKDTMLKTPNFKDLGVEGDKNENALSYVNMLSPYMQKWIIPYTIYIDTQDDDFVNGIMNNIYHPVDVKFFQLKKLVKNSTFEYYMDCYTYTAWKYVYKLDGKIKFETEMQIGAGTKIEGRNTKDYPLGEYKKGETYIGTETRNGVEYDKYRVRYEVSKLTEPNKIAKDKSGNPMVRSVKIERKLENAETVPEITYIGGFYEIIEKEFTINPIDETGIPNESSTGNLNVKGNTGTQVLTESWKESVNQISYNQTNYELSYLTEEQLESLGRRVSIIEWYQDSKGMVSSPDGEGGSGGVSATQQAYVDTYREDALNDMNQSGVLASITLAQGILEGGAGKSKLASQYNNHFGIKAGSKWTGATVTMRTGEYTKSGSRYTTDAVFRAYSSAADSFADHSRFVWNTKGSNKAGGFRYRDATEYAKTMNYMAPDGQPTYNYRAAIQAIVDGGYCTDPKYVGKICDIIEKYKLYEIDRQSTWDGTPPSYAEEGTGEGGSGSGSSTGMGETEYSYEDMEFAFYQIEQWYELHSPNYSALNLADRVILPEGGFAWPVQYYGDDKARSIYRFYNVTLPDNSTHKGIDISTGDTMFWDDDKGLDKGANVVATHPGTVTKVQKVTDATKNAYIEIKTEDGFFRTRYCYLSEINVNEGDVVEKDQVIGRIGKTGGAHTGDTELYLHYEVYYKGENMDPLTYYNITYNGEKVENYDELDLNSITDPKNYRYESSKLYLGGSSEVVNFAMQFIGNTLATMNKIRGTNWHDHWCAWFATWCYKECGLGDIVDVSNPNYCPTVWNEAGGVKHPHGDGYVPQPGDLVLFHNGTRYNHIAIVSKIENGVVYWIGGNQGGNCPSGSHVTENSHDSRTKSYISVN